MPGNGRATCDLNSVYRGGAGGGAGKGVSGRQAEGESAGMQQSPLCESRLQNHYYAVTKVRR